MQKPRAMKAVVITALVGLMTVAGCRGGRGGEAAFVDDERIPVGDSPYKGPSDAPITIVEFSNFRCGFCGRVKDTLNRLLEEYPDDVRIVFKHSPSPRMQHSVLAAEAAIEAHQQGKFWELHDKMFENMRTLNRETIDRLAEEVGLDMDRFKHALDNNTHKEVWERDQAIATRLGSRGTPGFYINGVQVRGAQPYENFEKVVKAELEAIEEVVGEGTARHEVYPLRLDANIAPPPPQEDPNAVYRAEVGESPYRGNSNALVTIVEYSDFGCGWCGRVQPTINELLEEYGEDLRVVFKHNPMSPQNMKGPAMAAMAAHEQGKFTEMKMKLFEANRAFSPDDLERYARELGLDMKEFRAYMAEEKGTEHIRNDQRLANQLGARGTPHFFINGRKLAGAQPIENFRRVIDAEMAKAKKMVEEGTEPGQVYAEIMKTAATAPVMINAGGSAAGNRPIGRRPLPGRPRRKAD